MYEPPGDDADLETRVDKMAFVKEGFSWPALFLPALWLIFQRMWLELFVFLLVIAALPMVFGVEEFGRQAAGWTTLGLTILFAFEANDLRSWALQRRGYRFAGVTSGRDRVDAERSFFTGWLPEHERRRMFPPPAAAKTAKSAAITPTRPSGGDEVIGSFPRA